MKPFVRLFIAECLLPVLLYGADMMTPAFYQDDAFRKQADVFITACHAIPLRHLLQNAAGKIPDYTVPSMGSFGAGKGPTRTQQHHPATDLHVGNRKTDVEIFAAHGGTVATFRDAPKYRHYISVTQSVINEAGEVLGKLVTLYGHVDLDLDEAGGLSMNGKTVRAGDLISKHLYSGTMGGPHLHFEIRYYRPNDEGTEEFYGFAGPRGGGRWTVPGTGDWPYGMWMPDTGYGYGRPESHGLKLD